MTKTLKFLLSEPLVHFLVLGALLYAYYNAQSSDTASAIIEKKIKLQKEPNESNTSIAFKEYQQVLLQEAYNLDLEKKDALIVERLISQMEFILQGSRNFTEPSEEKLYQFYKENIREYSEVKALSFHYLSFESEESVVLKKTLKIVNTITPSLFVNSIYLKNKNREFLTQQFGRYFTQKISTQFSQQWSKPIPSKGKNYLVYIDEKIVLEPLEFDAVEGRVYQDYKAIYMRKTRDEAYKKLLQSYIVEIE